MFQQRQPSIYWTSHTAFVRRKTPQWVQVFRLPLPLYLHVCVCSLSDVLVRGMYLSRHSLWLHLCPPDSCWGSVVASPSIPRKALLGPSIRLVCPGQQTNKHTHINKFFIFFPSQFFCNLLLFATHSWWIGMLYDLLVINFWMFFFAGSSPAWPVPHLQKASLIVPYRIHQI